MKIRILLFLLLSFSLFNSATAQSVLDPNDPVVNYDSTRPPQEPAWGQIGKWVRTPRFSWNTNVYKAYIYKGIAFRLKFPKSYDPLANDGKKYPMLVFWHGLMEAAPIYDNEFHLLLGCEYFSNAVDNGTFDGYVIAMQTQASLSGFFGAVHYTAMKEIIDYMVANNKLDPFRVMNNGLSSGGIASIDMFLQNPTSIAGLVAMSPPGDYTASSTVDKMKFTPVWYANGGVDTNPPPSMADYIYSTMQAAGAQFRKYTYPKNDHNTWDATWAEPDFWPFLKRAYASNPWPLYGKTSFAAGEAVSATLGLAPGFEGYEWRKDGVVIPGANTRSITATQLGTYDARVLRQGVWSEWSKKPVRLELAGSTVHIEAENYTSMLGIQTETCSDEGGGLNVGWQDNNDWMDYSLSVPAAGTYTVNFRLASMFSGAQFQLRNSSGTVLTTLTVPNTGSFQSWTTITTQVSLPAGQQTLRIFTTSANGGWNINWWELQQGGTGPANQPPQVSAGSAQSITLPTSSVQLSGTASDPDGTISSVSWTKIAGPAGSSFTSPGSLQTGVTGLVEGSYTFRLTVTDNAGASASSDVVVTVHAAPVSSSRIEAENFSAMFGIQTEPCNDAGGGLNVGWQDDNDWMDYPVNIPSAGTYTINFRVASMFTGAAFDLRNASGTALASLTVPNTGNFQSWTTITAQVNLPAGQQTLRIHTTKANGGWNINWWEITGGTATTVNQPPVVSAGSSQTIILPASSVTLNGSATDADGTISSMLWTQESGPSTASFSNPASASTSVSGLTEGSYLFRLTATDNSGASGSSTVTVTVQPATVTPVTSVRIEAESYSGMSGVQTGSTQDAGGGLQVQGQDAGDWMDYPVNLPVAGLYTLNFRVACISSGTQFEIRNGDGSLIVKLTIPNTGSLQNWQTVSTQASLSSGQQTLRIVTVKTKNSWNLNWWELVSGGGAALMTVAPAETLQDGPASALHAYPNPAGDAVTLVMQQPLTGRMRVELVNLLGVTQKQWRLEKTATGAQSYRLLLGGVQKGNYLLRVTMNNRSEVMQLVKL